MTKKEMENAMSFIVEQQAQFAVNQEQVERRVSRLERAAVTVIGMIGDLAKSNKELAEAQKRTEEKLDALIEAHAETGERLNIFINVVERHISNGQNGKSQ